MTLVPQILLDSVTFDPPLTGAFKMGGYQRPLASLMLSGRGGDGIQTRVIINPASYEGPEHNMMMDLSLDQAKKFSARLSQFLSSLEEKIKTVVDAESAKG